MNQLAQLAARERRAQLGENFQMRARRRRDEKQQPRDGLFVRRGFVDGERVAQQHDGENAGVAAERDGRAQMRQRESAADQRPGNSVRRAQPLLQHLAHGRRRAGKFGDDVCEQIEDVGGGNVAPDAAGAEHGFELFSALNFGCVPGRGSRPWRPARATRPSPPPGRGQRAAVPGRSTCGSPSLRIQPSTSLSSTPSDWASSMMFRNIGIVGERSNCGRHSMASGRQVSFRLIASKTKMRR